MGGNGRGQKRTRTVHGDARDAAPALQDLQPDDELHAAAGVQAAGADAEEHVEVRVALGLLGLEVDDVLDLGQLGLRLACFSAGRAAQPLQDVQRLLVAAHPAQPARRLGEHPAADRKAPAERGAPLVDEADAEGEPVRDDDAEDVEGELHGDERSSRRVVSQLGRPGRHDGVQYPRPDAVDEARADHPLCILCRRLKGGAEYGPRRADADGRDASEAVADEAAQQAAQQRAQVVDGHDAALQQGFGDDGRAAGVDVAEAHEVDVVRRFVDAAHHALVVACRCADEYGLLRGQWDGGLGTEEEDREAGDAADGDEEGSPLKMIGCDHPSLALIQDAGHGVTSR